MKRTPPLPLVFFLTLLSFGLHFVWENLQAPLYIGYTGVLEHMQICLYATFGDVFITLGLYGAVALLRRNWFWPREATWTTWGLLLLAGGFVAVLIEFHALSTGRWYYTDAMPLLPLVHVGFFPTLQLVVLPPLIAWSSCALSLSSSNKDHEQDTR